MTANTPFKEPATVLLSLSPHIRILTTATLAQTKILNKTWLGFSAKSKKARILWQLGTNYKESANER